jgi:hypothetical protein
MQIHAMVWQKARPSPVGGQVITKQAKPLAPALQAPQICFSGASSRLSSEMSEGKSRNWKYER